MEYESQTGNLATESGVVLNDDRLFGYSTAGRGRGYRDQVLGKRLFVQRVEHDDNFIEAMELDLIAVEKRVSENEAILRMKVAAQESLPRANGTGLLQSLHAHERSSQSVIRVGDRTNSEWRLSA